MSFIFRHLSEVPCCGFHEFSSRGSSTQPTQKLHSGKSSLSDFPKLRLHFPRVHERAPFQCSGTDRPADPASIPLIGKNPSNVSERKMIVISGWSFHVSIHQWKTNSRDRGYAENGARNASQRWLVNRIHPVFKRLATLAPPRRITLFQ